ncbi:MAG: hypothetical protein NUV77_24230 [Thermoguttaceae bacterium]|nr:hypothetical protein [Thermoguttaceae bacterium]
MPLVPEELARQVRLALNSREVREAESRFQERLDERLESLVGRANRADELKRDLQALSRKARGAARFADRPAAGYAAYSVKVSGFTRALRTLLKRVEDALENQER